MNPSYAAIFSVQPLELNQHFQTVSDAPLEHISTPQQTPITLPLQLHQDLEKALSPLVITQIVKATSISWQEGCLSLPSDKLTNEQKKQLWSLIGEQLDKL
ncbi:hypothetical protein [Pseudoalteromonas sp. L21]|uniref:hypothetical protein n=1 Tax=unclassified Pseudoalteromonas TaxID=194690 RepID=UPI00187E53E7|nr:MULTISPECIES: hypothetical protein [Gammaproteobacteria]MCF7517174.1 hypothetical protein [Pseudoalteromonas sp. L21]|tara:strand:- start:3243 stop:3545 length:303 start_codon:yes stop_codon:yes gene_type:complete